MDINVSFDNQYRLTDSTDIGTIKILMLRGERGESGAGAGDYDELTNRPQINSYTITGNKTAGEYGLATLTDLSEVAGDIPEATSELQNDSGFITASDIPAIPSKTSDLQNDSGFITSAAVPTKTSELQNDSGFITSAALPTKTSDLQNDSGFITSASVPTKTSELQNDSGFITSSSLPTKTSDLSNDSGFITSAALPTKTSDLTNDSGFLASAGVVDLIYPVGSIYMSVNSVSPATLFGGTWEQIKDKFLLSAGDTYTAGDTGGESEHALTKAELPSINGSIALRDRTLNAAENPTTTGVFSTTSGANALKVSETSTYASGSTISMSFGGGGAHNNMPPYLTVNIWKRTA